ncbi:zinc finger protein 692-like [Ambystoma mexicanum]|uniref:zinc finger protein 692-like n=1 Tax=Ambystoma mexicanum TaxID=8296 RepID=UPI0037E82967
MDTQNLQGRPRAPEAVRKQKRKELDARRSKCRIRIGSHLDQWCILKQELGFSLHSQLAKFLLDSYSSSIAVMCAEQLGVDILPGRFFVSGDALQQLVVLCHDHSQDCGFIPNLKLRTPLERKGLARALLWQCLAGHKFSWSLSLSTNHEDIPHTHPRTASVSERADAEVSPRKRSPCGTKRIQPVQSSRRLRCAGSSKQPAAMEGLTIGERTEASNVFQSTLNANWSHKERQEVSEEVTADPNDSSDDNLCSSSEASEDMYCGSQTTDGGHLIKRATSRCQWAIFDVASPRKKRRTAEPQGPTQRRSMVLEGETTHSSNSSERVLSGEQAPCSEPSPKDCSSFQALSLEADDLPAMPGFDITHEGVQGESMPGIPDKNSAKEMQQDGDSTETHEDDQTFVPGLQDENYIPPQNTDQQHLRHADEDMPQIVRKRIRKTAKVEIIQCDYEGCDKIFSNRQYLNHHKKYQHVNQFTFTCSEPSCGKSFSFKKHLKEHEKKHSDRRDFICEFCARAFRSSSNLVIHRRIHTGEKPLQCEICGVTCRQKASLNWHMKKHDADSFYLFSCDACGKKFEKRDNVTAHKKKKHPGASLPVESHKVSGGSSDRSVVSLSETITKPSNTATPGDIGSET